MWVNLNVWHSLFQNEHHLAGRLVDLVEIDDSRTGRRQLQHADLMNDLRPAVLALPPLPHVLGCVHFPCALLHTLPHHSKLTSDGERRQQEERLLADRIFHRYHIEITIWSMSIMTTSSRHLYWIGMNITAEIKATAGINACVYRSLRVSVWMSAVVSSDTQTQYNRTWTCKFHL